MQSDLLHSYRNRRSNDLATAGQARSTLHPEVCRPEVLVEKVTKCLQEIGQRVSHCIALQQMLKKARLGEGNCEQLVMQTLLKTRLDEENQVQAMRQMLQKARLGKESQVQVVRQMLLETRLGNENCVPVFNQ